MIYCWITCCGTSSIAEKLVEEFGFSYYKCKDHLGGSIDINQLYNEVKEALNYENH